MRVTVFGVGKDGATRAVWLSVWHHAERETVTTKRFEVGARVHEPTYGSGSVISVEDAFTRIQFDDNTVRKFLTSLAKLEPTNEPAPAARPHRARKRKAAASAKSKAKQAAAVEIDLDAVDANVAAGNAALDADIGD